MNFLQKIWKNDYLRNFIIACSCVVGLILVTMLFLNIYTRHGQSLPVPDFKGLQVDEAKALAKKSRLKIEVVDSIFRPAFAAGSVLEQNPKPESRVKKNRKIFLTINCVMPKKIDAPNLVGFSLRQGKAVLESRGLKVGKLRYTSDIATNIILDQRYKGRTLMPDEPIFIGSEVDLVLGINEESEVKTSIPSVTGLTLDAARSNLADLSLNLGRAQFDRSVVTTADTLAAVVYKQSPGPSKANSSTLGSSVDIFLTIDRTKIPR